MHISKALMHVCTLYYSTSMGILYLPCSLVVRMHLKYNTRVHIIGFTRFKHTMHYSFLRIHKELNLSLSKSIKASNKMNRS